MVTLSGIGKGMPLAEDVYRLCIAQPVNYSEQLYNKLKELLNEHVESEKKVCMAQLWQKKTSSQVLAGAA